MKEYLSNVLEILEEKGVLNESYDLEFKSAKGGLPRSLWESYSAFANSEGGTIILGVSEKDNYCYLDGLGEDVVRKWLDDFWNQINNKEKVSVNLLTAKDVRNMYGDALVILSTAEIEGVVSNLRLQGLLNKHSSEISIMLKDLCSQGYLNPENKGRWTSYHLNKGIGLKQGSLFENLDGHLNEKMDTSDKKDGHLNEKMDTSDKKDGHLGRNMQEIKSSELKSYIVEICSSKYLTIEEIAVKTRLKDGLLERLYPTTPNHPNQAYKKKQQ